MLISYNHFASWYGSISIPV